MEFEPVRLNNLYNIPGSRYKSKRLGRGIGSGKGKTAGRGVKGQKARSGVSIRWFEGGQMPIIKRLPKRGFNPLERKNYNVVNLEFFNFLLETKLLNPGQIIDKKLLVELGVVKNTNKLVKLLGNEELKAKLTFELDAYSSNAKEHVLKAGGEVK